MIDPELQDLAADYVMDELSVAEARAFEARLATDAELRKLTAELQDAVAALARNVPQRTPSAALRDRVLAAAHAEAQAITPAPAAAKSGGFGFLPWALAAGLAITTAALWTERNQLRQEADSLQKDVLALRTGDNFSKMRIASLSAQLDAYAKGTAVIVWDAEKQRGVVKLSNMPPAGNGKDYQLWVIDPKYAKPVNGGIIPVSQDGLARVSFTPDQLVHKADKFAISLEKTGGVPQAAGPIVLLGE